TFDRTWCSEQISILREPRAPPPRPLLHAPRDPHAAGRVPRRLRLAKGATAAKDAHRSLGCPRDGPQPRQRHRRGDARGIHPRRKCLQRRGARRPADPKAALRGQRRADAPARAGRRDAARRRPEVQGLAQPCQERFRPPSRLGPHLRHPRHALTDPAVARPPRRDAAPPRPLGPADYFTRLCS
ncbi:hypothetical protein M885DRAFT_625873, partial [Pelagophyceae sp. CCMP2097]